MKTNTQAAKRLLSALLCLTMLLACMPLIAAAESYTYKGGAGTAVVDPDASSKYSDSLGDNASTEFAGRVWADRSVYLNDVTFTTYGGGTTTVKLNENQAGEDFLVAFSSLATTESVSGQAQAPVDVVFVIDTSASMNDDMSSTDKTNRIVNTVKVLNDSIDKLMALNEYTRVGVVAFAGTSEVLLPLGRYEKGSRTSGPIYSQTTVTNYFSLSGNNGTLYVHAKKAGTNDTFTDSRSITGGTNIQRGIYEGMNMLATETSTTADINGSTVRRVPSIVCLSDGAPTFSATDVRNNSATTRWWNPANNSNGGDGNTPYYGNGMLTLMTGAYMKKAIDANYGITGTNYATTFYTVGMGITNLSNYTSSKGSTYYTGAKDLAQFTLYPRAYWDSSDDMATAIVEAWKNYTNQTPGGNATVNITTGFNEKYTLYHPTNDIFTASDKDALKDLVDSYYGADNADSLTSVFDSIMSNISISAPQVPTEIKGTDPMTDGYITYTDPIGEYLEVKDVKAIIYAGHTFTAKAVTTSGNVTTYAFAGEVHSAVYGDQQLQNIVITVTDNGTKQVLTIKIPASAIPLRVNEILLNADGSVKTHANNGALPARIVYSVGLQSEIVKEAADGTAYIDTSKLSDEYIADHRNADGSIDFYSSMFTNVHTVNGSTVGDATIEFEPSHTNGFYYILEDMPIYKDAAFTQQVSAAEGLDPDATYYYKDEHYHGSSVEITAAARTGAQLMRTEVITGSDGYLYRKAGEPHLNRILKFEGTKNPNVTGTAEDFYAPEFHYADGSTNAYDGKFIVHLGNNGKLSVTTGGNLQITKQVTAGDGLTAPDKDFVFTLDIADNGTYDYTVTDAQGTAVSNGTISAASPTISLKDGQTATVFSLPPDTAYAVTETPVSGFTSQAEGATGIIKAGKTAVASFTNTYNITAFATFNVSGQKELDGRLWSAGDAFSFLLLPYSDAPLPVGYNVNAGVTVTQPDTVAGKIATFDFGTITFTAPGVYRYTIEEKQPESGEALPGLSYSGALYRLVVTVADNGDGTLSVASTDLQKLYTDGAEALFTYVDGQIILNAGQEPQDELKFVNAYTVSAVTRTPVALKEYTDNSGRTPLVSGMFSFELEALGVVENGKVVPDTVSRVPMPAGSVNGSFITVNEGHNITFPSVTYTQSLVPAGAESIVFRYVMREVIPSTPVNGMEYDDTAFIVDVTVALSPNSSELIVTADYSGTGIATFKNTYTPTPVSADINGSKTLNGRDMLPGETFEFVLSANASTSNAIRNGTVTVPSDTAAVTDAKDGVAKPFAFENITFKKAGTYVFTVSETQGNAPAVEYDDRVVTVTVVIDDTNADGNLEVVSVTYGGASSANFTNTYTATFSGNPVSLEGVKALTGKTLLAGEFYFDVQERINGNAVANRFVSHSEDTTPDENGVYTGSITLLKDVTYDAAGVYEYYISEQIPTDKVHGTTYDDSRFRYTVVVENDNAGNLKVTSAKLEKATDAGWEGTSEVVFSNTYTPTPTTAVLPTLNKVLDGDRSKPLKDGEFDFELTLYSADPTDGVTLPSNTVVSNAADGTIRFDAVTFTKAGTYILFVKEIVPADADKAAGITYSEQTIAAAYRVVDDRNGNLSATLFQLVGGENIINLYKADPAEVTVEVSKDFTGRANDEWLTTDVFEFLVKVTDADTLAAFERGDIEATFDNGSTDTVTLTVSAKGDVASTDFKINKPGTYKLVVSEVNGGIKGVTFDTSEKEVVIVATDDSATAKIRVTVNGQDINKASLTFSNVYASGASDSVNITANKTVTPSAGNNFTLKGGEFTFVIESVQGAPMPNETTVSNAADGTVDFGSITYTETGIYVYTVREQQGDLGGFTYDGEVYTVTVTVTHDYANAKLVTAVTVTDSDGNDAAPVFNNQYDPKETSALIFGSKTLDSEYKRLEADEFTFVLEAVTQDAPMPDENLVTNAVSGVFQFGAITYTKVGTYAYTVTEKNLGADGYTYDDTVYTVSVTVTDEGGVLNAIVDGVGTVEAPTVKFVNKYAPRAVGLTVGAQGELIKELDGRGLNTEEFVFAVLNEKGEEITTAKNAKNGTFSFALSFTEAGNYAYTIVEKNNAVGGIIYDDTVYGLDVTVTDKGGYLEADSVTYTLEGAPVTEIVFRNVYKADATDVTVTAIKELIGRDLADGEFKFVIKDADGTVIATATNTEDGSIAFDKIVVSEAGNYAYTVFEEMGKLANVTYDETEYVVTFTVTDDGSGKLSASDPVIRKVGENGTVSTIVFENVYVAPPRTENPKTGDDTNTNVFLALLGAGSAVVALAFTKRKKKIEDQ